MKEGDKVVFKGNLWTVLNNYNGAMELVHCSGDHYIVTGKVTITMIGKRWLMREVF